jgi:flagellar basal-body rod modification protein FlgD
VLLDVYDVSGRLVRSVDLGECPAGTHTATWDGNDADGHRVASGVYFLTLNTGRTSLSTKVIRLE